MQVKERALRKLLYARLQFTLLADVDGMPAGKEGRVMRVRGDMLLIGCRSAQRLELVLARSWEVLPEHKWVRKREGIG